MIYLFQLVGPHDLGFLAGKAERFNEYRILDEWNQMSRKDGIQS